MIDLLEAHKNEVYLLPKELDEKGRKLHLPALRAKLNVFTQGQAVSTGVKVEGPHMGGRYRY